MKRTKSRRSRPTDQFELLTQLGDRLRQEHGEVRYIERTEHDGERWTVSATWERFVGGEWVAFDLPMSNY